ncbi:MAG: SDR family oxidoreductase [Leptospiraceae bacterium]|nr:SDR family oxidoreductase [Leptospiraceae bacterium]
MSKKVLIIGLSSDIGEKLGEYFIKDGHEVFGTCRSTINNNHFVEDNICKLDLDSKNYDKEFLGFLEDKNEKFSIIIFSIGNLEPIGDFYSLDFCKWEQSLYLNSIAQIRVLHVLRKFLIDSANVFFFHGGSPNGVLENYSAYSIGKILLAKMVEYLSVEDPNIIYTILGTGWVNTKIHLQTLKAVKESGKNYERTQEFLNQPEKGTDISEIYNCIQWIVKNGKDSVNGRNIAIVSDYINNPNRDNIFSLLDNDSNIYKLRRKDI